MRDNKGLTMVALVITIVAILILVGVAFKFFIGNLVQVTTDEKTYNTSEVIEELNILIREKYIASYKQASQDGKTSEIQNYYNGEILFKFLQGENEDSKKYIEPLNNFSSTVDDTRYYVIISSLGESIDKYGAGENDFEGSKDYFYIKTSGDESNSIQSAKLFYKNSKGEEEEVGDLELAPEI